MIAFKIGSDFLDLDGGSQIEIVLASPLFSDFLGYSSHSFTFTFPQSRHNKDVLDQPEAVLTVGNTISHSCKIYLEGIPWRRAILDINEAGGRYEGRLDIEEAEFARAIKDKTLRNYDFGGVRAISANPLYQGTLDMVAHANGVAPATIATFDYNFFPVRNPSMYADGGSLVSGSPHDMINYWANGGFFDLESALNAGKPDYTYNLVPFPYLLYVLQHVIEAESFTVGSSDWWNDPEIRTLSIFNTQTLDGQIYSFAFGIGTVESHHYQTDIDLRRHVPDTDIREYISGVKLLFNLALIVRDQEVRFVAKRDILTDTEQIDWREFCLVGHTVKYEEYPGGIFFSELDPADQLNEEPELQEERFDIDITVDDIPALPVATAPGEIAWVRDTNQLFRADGNLAWQLVSYELFPVEIAPAEDPFTSIISTTEPTHDLWYDTHYWRIPKVDQIGNSDAYSYRGAFSPRLLFARGIVLDDASAGTYPLGSPDDRMGVYNYSLFWHGDRGLYEIWHKPWEEMLAASKTILYPLDLGIDQLFNLKWEKKHRVLTELGEALTLVREIRIQFSLEGIESINADLVRL